MRSDAAAASAADLGARLRTLYDAHYRHLVKVASFYLDDVGSCEEVVQDAFVALLSGRHHIAVGAEGAYLRSAVLNGARSRLRKRQVRDRARPVPASPSHPVSPEDHAVDRTEGRRLLEAVRSLAPGQADVLVLRYYLDMSEAEIAETLGIAPGTVKSHAHRGLANLHRILEGGR